jgi:predicted NAD/FAD-binding protein
MTIAVVGSGVAGLGAAYALSRSHAVELFEADERPGGHVNTVSAGSRQLDTGFIVHNTANYPQLTRLFRELGVETQPSEMSFSVSCACGLEWSSRRPWTCGPALLREIVRFLRTADAGDARGLTLAEYVRARGYSEVFRRHYLVPMTAALWSTAPSLALEFPAETLIRFFENHRMLGFRRHPWRTVTGGSQTYVRALLERSGLPIHLGAPVRSLRRSAEGVELRTDDGVLRRFDGVVVATHAPQALALLADPSDDEQRLLSTFATTSNETVLHTDTRVLPRTTGARSSWNVRVETCGDDQARPTMTYLLNRLQRLEGDEQYCVTLNQTAAIEPTRIIRTIRYEHPQMTLASAAAQAELHTLNGQRATAFCGAWQGNGFHEDGLVSGLRAAEAFGARW